MLFSECISMQTAIMKMFVIFLIVQCQDGTLLIFFKGKSTAQVNEKLKIIMDSCWTHVALFSCSFLLVFRVMCGEWVEPLWDCLTVAGASCAFYFSSLFLLGYIVLFHVILALVMSSFFHDNDIGNIQYCSTSINELFKKSLEPSSLFNFPTYSGEGV